MNRTLALVIVPALVVLGACGSSPKEKLYTLSATAGAAQAAREEQPLAIALGPVTVPELVDRPQFVLRAAANQVTLAEQSRWAEPLRFALPRVLAVNLAHALGEARVSLYPQSPVEPGDIRVIIDVTRFDSLPGEAVLVEAQWTVRTGKGNARSARASVREPVAGSDHDALVAAHSRALATLGQRLAETVRAAAAK